MKILPLICFSIILASPRAGALDEPLTETTPLEKGKQKLHENQEEHVLYEIDLDEEQREVSLHELSRTSNNPLAKCCIIL